MEIIYVIQKRHPNRTKEWDRFRRWHDHPELSVGEKHSSIQRCDELNLANEGVDYRVIKRTDEIIHKPNEKA